MTTNFIAKLNKSEAAFHILGILSRADGTSNATEKSIILDFLEQNFESEEINLIKEQAFLTALPSTEYSLHFEEVCGRFYTLSTIDERNKLIEFAMKVVMADKQMKDLENRLIEKLFTAWDLNRGI